MLMIVLVIDNDPVEHEQEVQKNREENTFSPRVEFWF